MAVGLFVGCLPIYGFQLPVVLAICMPLRLDSAVAYVAAHVSNPITLPFVLAAELETGALLLTGHHATLTWTAAKALGFAAVGLRLAVGSIVVGGALALIGGTTTWLVAHRVTDARERELARARQRTLARYAGGSKSVSSYVALKLRTDPSLREILALGGDLGRVVDAGAGYFQLGLCLLELGRLTSLTGIEADPERVRVGRAAARTDATLLEESLADSSIPPADTVLFVDSLHYLPVDVQDAVIARAAHALSPGGRIIIREVHVGASFRSKITEWLERRAVEKRAKGEHLAFRPAADLARVLERHGVPARIVAYEDFSLAHNVLIVGTRPKPEGTPAP